VPYPTLLGLDIVGSKEDATIKDNSGTRRNGMEERRGLALRDPFQATIKLEIIRLIGAHCSRPRAR